MESYFFKVIEVLGAIAFFIFGMKTMSDGIQKAAGSQLRYILSSMTKNKYLGVLTGMTTTAMVQSSSATTVMTVSFVNAGLITLTESAGIMMGANVGTTITAWIISFKLFYICPILLLVGVIMIFRTKGTPKYWGEFLIGFAILFISLNMLESAAPDIEGNLPVLERIINWSSNGFVSTLTFVMIGAVITILLQSSSAAIALTVTLCTTGWIPFEMGAAMVLGENIGTTITAEFAAIVAHRDAKRSARIHSLFNLIGVAWAVILLPFFLDGVIWIGDHLFQINDPRKDTNSIPVAIASFHTLFNILNVLLLLPFVNLLVKVAKLTIPEKEDERGDKHQFKYINNIIKSPELAIGELQKEIVDFCLIGLEFSELLYVANNNIERKKQKKAVSAIKKLEKLTDKIEREIVSYITDLSKKELTTRTSTKCRAYLNICSDLERIGDLYYQIAQEWELKLDEKIWFTPVQRNGLNDLLNLVKQLTDLTILRSKQIKTTEEEYEACKVLENTIDKQEESLRQKNIESLKEEDTHVKGVMILNKIINDLENVSDHLMSINQHLNVKT